MVPAVITPSDLPPRPHPDDIPPGGFPKPPRRHAPSEIVRKGEEIFDRDVRPTLPPDPPPHHILIDVDGGGWIVDEDDVRAYERFFERWPNARGYSRLLNSPTVGRMGPRGPA